MIPSLVMLKLMTLVKVVDVIRMWIEERDDEENDVINFFFFFLLCFDKTMSSSSSSSSSGAGRPIDITTLSLKQLEGLKSSVDEELERLTESHAQLKEAIARYLACKETLQSLNEENKGKQIFIPLTDSVRPPSQTSHASLPFVL